MDFPSNNMLVAFLLALLAPYSLGCAPVSPTNNGTETSKTSSKGTFSMVINPPAMWTTTTGTPVPPQQLNVDAVTKAMNMQIGQAVKSLFYENAKPVTTVNVTVDHPVALDTVDIIALSACAGTGYVVDNDDNVYAHCGAANGEIGNPFEVTITGTFDTGSPGLAVTTAMWDALAVSLQNKLSIPPYNLRFKEQLKVTPSGTKE